VRRPSKATSTHIEFYESLIHQTASMYVSFVEEDFEDIVSIVRIKAWRAVQTYDPQRSSMPCEWYVFSCVKNQAKDVVKRKRRRELYIEDRSADGREMFEAPYLHADETQTFGLVDDGEVLLPSTLTLLERRVIALLYLDYSRREAAVQLGLKRNELERAVGTIRLKLPDSQPSAADRPTPIAA
jgi:RNA polymerase sigma factor (sigma-70 family)